MLKAPSGEPQTEVWPGHATAGDVLTVIARSAGLSEKGLSIRLARTGRALKFSDALGDSELVDGDTLEAVDLTTVKRAREAYLESAQAAVAHGYAAPPVAAQIARARDDAGLSEADAAQLLTERSVPPDWVKALAAGAVYYPPNVEEYRHTLEGLKGRAISADLVRVLMRLRKRHGITDVVHTDLGRLVGLHPDDLAKLLRSPEPTRAEREEYLNALRKCQGASPPATALRQLAQLAHALAMEPTEHDLLALEVGSSLQDARSLWVKLKQVPVEPAGTMTSAVGGPLPAGNDAGSRSAGADVPGPGAAHHAAGPSGARPGSDPARAAAAERYKEALKGVWIDHNISAGERKALALLRAQLRVTDAEHLTLATSVGIPLAQARAALGSGKGSVALRWMAAAGVLAAALGGGWWWGHGRLFAGHISRPRSTSPSGAGVASAGAAARGGDHASPSGAPDPDAPDGQSDTRGTLILNSEPPDATVRVDGTVRGKTPVSLKLAEGSHLVSVAKEDFVTLVRTIEIKAGDDRPENFRLAPRNAKAGKDNDGGDDE